MYRQMAMETIATYHPFEKTRLQNCQIRLKYTLRLQTPYMVQKVNFFIFTNSESLKMTHSYMQNSTDFFQNFTK